MRRLVRSTLRNGGVHLTRGQLTPVITSGLMPEVREEGHTTILSGEHASVGKNTSEQFFPIAGNLNIRRNYRSGTRSYTSIARGYVDKLKVKFCSKVTGKEINTGVDASGYDVDKIIENPQKYGFQADVFEAGELTYNSTKYKSVFYEGLFNKDSRVAIIGGEVVDNEMLEGIKTDLVHCVRTGAVEEKKKKKKDKDNSYFEERGWIQTIIEERIISNSSEKNFCRE